MKASLYLAAALLTMILPFTTVLVVILQYEMSIDLPDKQVVFLQLLAFLSFRGSVHYPLANSA